LAAIQRRLNRTETVGEDSTGKTAKTTMRRYRTVALRPEGSHAASVEVKTGGEDWKEHTNVEEHSSSSGGHRAGQQLQRREAEEAPGIATGAAKEAGQVIASAPHRGGR